MRKNMIKSFILTFVLLLCFLSCEFRANVKTDPVENTQIKNSCKINQRVEFFDKTKHTYSVITEVEQTKLDRTEKHRVYDSDRDSWFDRHYNIYYTGCPVRYQVDHVLIDSLSSIKESEYARIYPEYIKIKHYLGVE